MARKNKKKERKGQQQKRRTYRKAKDYLGKKFGKLLVIRVPDKKTPHGGSFLTCHCFCGVIKDVRLSNLAYGHVISCGCVFKERTKKSSGSNEISRLRSSSKYKRFRKCIKKKFKYTCICCGQKGPRKNNNLTVHHIMAVHKYPELIFNKVNGVLLCERCHIRGKKAFHRLYGSVNFTANDFYDFMKEYSVFSTSELLRSLRFGLK